VQTTGDFLLKALHFLSD